MLAPEGRCKTLAAAADGYVRAEAAGAIALRQVTQSAGAPAALALLLGSAVNQDGRSSALTAPNGPAQQEVIRTALKVAGAAPTDLLTLQMHGTGEMLSLTGAHVAQAPLP